MTYLNKATFTSLFHRAEQLLKHIILFAGLLWGTPVLAQQADILFVIDTSRSMQGDINQVKARIVEFNNAMVTNGIDAHYALVRFGGSSTLIQDVVPFDTFNTADSPFQRLSANGGGTERGSQGVRVGLRDATFRPGAVTNIILITDEDDDTSLSEYNQATAAIEQQRALFNFIGVPGTGNTNARYGVLADSFGGVAFQIVEFRNNPAPFFTNFIQTKVREIIDALVCDVDLDRDIDRNDITAIFAARNQPVTGAADPRDPDRNGVINVLDARACTQMCSVAGCRIIDGNEAPIANAGPDQIAQLAEQPTVTLNGGNSSDVNNDVLTYNWSILASPVGSSITLNDTASETPSFVPDIVGIYTFQLIVNDGREDSDPDTVSIEVFNRLVEVPQLLNLTLAEAESAILAAGLTIGQVTEANSETVAAGRVVDVNPSIGEVISEDVSIDLVISLGPVVTVEIPDVTGLTQEEAVAQLTALGLTVGEITQVNSVDVPIGSVVSITPAPGQIIPDTEPVAISVSVGPTAIVLPDVAGLSLSEAQAVLTNAGFVVGIVTRVTSTTIPIDQVIDTDPSFGNLVEPGSLINLLVSDGPDVTPPTAIISSPGAGDTLLPGSIAIEGTADDANLVSWLLEYAPAGTQDWVEINSDTQPVIDGVLGTFSTGVLRSNFYRLRLTVNDGAFVASTFIDVGVDNQLQLGRFELVFDDLVLPNSQLPITLRRVYDSSIPETGDFGRGWRLSLSGVDIQEDANQNVFLTLPDGRRKSFAFTPQRVSPFFPGSTPQYTAPPGVQDTLVATDECGLVVLSNGQWFCFPGDQYNPDAYLLMTQDGYMFSIDQDFGIQRVEDRNGNFIEINEGGVTTSSGRNAVFERDTEGRITAITDPNGNRITYQYDSDGRLVDFTDQMGDKANFDYLNGSHFLTAVNTPGQCQPIRTEFDDSGRVSAKVDGNGNRNTYRYADSGQTEIITDARGSQYVYEYDSRGNVVDVLDPDGGRTLRTYNANDELTSITMPSGLVMQYNYNGQGQWVEQIEQPLVGDPLTTRRVFNANGQLTRYEEPLGNAIELSYDASGNVIERRWLGVDDTVFSSQNFTFDPFGNVLIQSVGNESFSYTYDAIGNMLTETNGEGITLTFEYDVNGNRTAVVNAVGVRTDITYSALNLPISSTTGTRVNYTATYNDNADVTSITDSTGAVTKFSYDCINNLTEVEDALGNKTQYGFDAVNSLASVTDAEGNVSQIGYDAIPRPSSRAEANGAQYGFNYTSDGFVSQTTTPNHPTGQNAFDYDGLNRVIKNTRPEGDIAFTYDANGKVISRVAEVSGDTIETQFGYDARTLLTSVTTNSRQIQYEYNDNLSRSGVTDPEGVSTQYSFDNAGNLNQIATGADNVSFVYDEAGQRSKVEYSNGTAVEYTFDEFGRLNTTVMRDAQGDVFAQFNSTLDANERRTAIVDNDVTHGFAYDSLGRLTSQTLAGDEIADLTESYTYDSVGNRLNNNAAYSNDGRLLSQTGITYTYDANGNLSTRGSESFAYNSSNELITYTNGTEITTYDYDSVGRRIRKTRGNDVTEYLYDNQNILVEYDGDGNVIARYTYGSAPDELFMVRRAGQTYFYHQNGQGHVVAITNASGEVVQRYAYDAWGNIVLNQGIFSLSGGNLVNTRTYTGREYDAESGLYHLRARAYDPSLGRFLQRDPERGRRTNPQSQHPYVYVNNDPVNLADPSGRVAAIQYASIISAPRADAAFIGFLHGFITPIFSFLGEYFSLLTPGVPQDQGELFRQAISQAEARVEDIETALGVNPITNSSTLYFKDAYLSGAGFSVGFQVNVTRVSVGIDGGNLCVGGDIGRNVAETPFRIGTRRELACIDFVGDQAGGFTNGTKQAFNYLRGIAPN